MQLKNPQTFRSKYNLCARYQEKSLMKFYGLLEGFKPTSFLFAHAVLPVLRKSFVDFLYK